MTELAIVIVSFNTRNLLDQCLRSLHEHPPTTPHTIVVVDNGSGDGSVAAVRGAWPQLQLLALDNNVGYAAANNRGIRATDSDLILLLNSDTIVGSGAIDTLVAALRAEPEVGVAGPRLVDAAGQPELSFGRMIGPFSEARQQLRTLALAHAMPWISTRVARSLRLPHYPDWVSGACLLVRRAAAEHAGLLDERFFLYAEDVDFCAAVRQQGFRVRFSPEAEIVHLRGRSRATAPAAAQEAYRRSQLAFYAKHHPSWVPLLRLYLRLQGQLPG